MSKYIKIRKPPFLIFVLICLFSVYGFVIALIKLFELIF